MVCDTVAAAVERDLRGDDEQLMKEVCESCGQDECKIAADEMQAIVELMRNRIQVMRRMKEASTRDLLMAQQPTDSTSDR